MFANPNHPTVEYHYRPDGTRPYSHCEDRDLFRVINVEGDCVYYLRKLTDVFRVGPRAPYCPGPELSVPPLPSTPCCPMDCPYLQNRCLQHSGELGALGARRRMGTVAEP
jgi:hypothetical protein